MSRPHVAALSRSHLRFPCYPLPATARAVSCVRCPMQPCRAFRLVAPAAKHSEAQRAHIGVYVRLLCSLGHQMPTPPFVFNLSLFHYLASSKVINQCICPLLLSPPPIARSQPPVLRFLANAAMYGDTYSWHVDADPSTLPYPSPWTLAYGQYVNRVRKCVMAVGTGGEGLPCGRWSWSPERRTSTPTPTRVLETSRTASHGRELNDKPTPYPTSVSVPDVSVAILARPFTCVEAVHSRGGRWARPGRRW
jgi:hypothetical protein